MKTKLILNIFALLIVFLFFNVDKASADGPFWHWQEDSQMAACYECTGTQWCGGPTPNIDAWAPNYCSARITGWINADSCPASWSYRIMPGSYSEYDNSGGGDCCGGRPGFIQWSHWFYCDYVPKPVDGGWSDWSSFSACSASCNATGQTTRTRTCTNPTPSNGGAYCSGSATESYMCAGPPCPVDGYWSDWSGCSASCGGGTQTRSCTPPTNGGTACSGPSSQSCNTQACPINGACSSSHYSCSVGVDGNHSGSGSSWTWTCSGSNGGSDVSCSESKKTDGGWSAWSPASCPTACGQPASQLVRNCNNPPPSGGGASCSGSNTFACSATGSCNGAPNSPTISGATSGYANTSYTYTFTASDPQGEQIRYGVDWNMDGTADDWLPTGSYTTSGSSRSVNHSWSTTGSKTFQALTQDFSGVNSGWSNYTVVIAGAPITGVCGTANKTYPAGSTSYGSDTYCSLGTPSSSPAFPLAGSSVSWICLGSGGGGSSPTCTATLATDTTYSVTTIKKIGGFVVSTDNAINCGSTCTANYNSGSTVTLRAYPNSSYWKFGGWAGDCSGTGLCVLNVNSSKSVTPSFQLRLFNYFEF